ncbi:DUF4878 domain-containing protein [Antarcticibacterium flavum]|uniref:DUF4878 domain-containing protein n=1 Tax=Antarcticibacterium flavum TaxID=2058175 RepID=A0A5B7X6P7_9FLAO|nr:MULTISPECIES: DUF4878 domain-containing protein [Antarcticibacterium]MCM4160872.1 hypothetical protein [Antarcticibacterium sp. W02-3]QCY71097.1 DUF4878 domain-containing protein [Antarcticibacterium flavum]
MKKIMMIFILGLCMACAEAQMSHTETAKAVVESFYTKDLPTLEKHTTKESFDSFMYIQESFPAEEKGSNFKVLQETENGNTAWVKFTTAYEEQPETFKLVKENGNWKVAEIGMGEKGPF